MINAPDEHALSSLLARIDRALLRSAEVVAAVLPLEGRKLHLHSDWMPENP